MLVIAFLTRYIVWCAKARRFDRLRNAVDLLADISARGRRSRPALDTPHALIG